MSGGELSRVALAIKQVLAEADETPILVFDEVDTGIGGRSADPVGRSLWALARRHQVLCVTHLPQIAAHADAQYRITKRERDGRTVTEIERLDREGRIVELAQMLGGDAGGRPRWRAPASCSIVPRPGAPVSPRPARPVSRGRARRAIDEYLTYLDVERGLSPATIRAYRTDLADFAASRGVPVAGQGPPTRRSDTSRPGPAVAGRATPASRRAASAAGPPRSRGSTGSPTARA